MTVEEFKELCAAAIKIQPELKDSIEGLEVTEVGLKIDVGKHPEIRNMEQLLMTAKWVEEGRLLYLDMKQRTFTGLLLRSLYKTVMTLGQELFKLQELKQMLCKADDIVAEMQAKGVQVDTKLLEELKNE